MRREHFETFAAERGPGQAESDQTVQLDGRSGPLDAELSGLQLRGVGGVSGLRLRRSEGREAVAERVDQHLRSDDDKAITKGRHRLVGIDRCDHAAEDGAGVEPFLQPHQAHTGLGVAGQQRAFYRCRPPPPRQEREMDVEEGKRA